MVHTIGETTEVRLSPCMLLRHDQVLGYQMPPQCPEEPTQPRSAEMEGSKKCLLRKFQ